MIELLFMRKDYRSLAKGTMIPFLPGVNLLVGDQGCGKSTILQCLVALGGVKRSFWKKDQTRDIKEVAMLLVNKPLPVFAHDYENDSPRTSPAMDCMGQLPMGMTIGHMRGSHGQSSREINRLIGEQKNAYIILDEPDSGLSCRSALVLANDMKKAVAQGCQVIASVHHPWLIEQFKTVYSVERHQHMPSEKFLESMRDVSAFETPAPCSPAEPVEATEV